MEIPFHELSGLLANKKLNMGGIEFYRNAVDLNPAFNRQFMFISGDITPETSSFMQANHLFCLEKPFSLKRLSRLVQEIMDKTL